MPWLWTQKCHISNSHILEQYSWLALAVVKLLKDYNFCHWMEKTSLKIPYSNSDSSHKLELRLQGFWLSSQEYRSKMWLLLIWHFCAHNHGIWEKINYGSEMALIRLILSSDQKVDANAWCDVAYTMFPGNMDHVMPCSPGTWHCTDQTGPHCLFVHITWRTLDQSRSHNSDQDMTTINLSHLWVTLTNFTSLDNSD